MSSETLGNVKFIQEKKLLGCFFDQISQDTGKYCFGVKDTLQALELGAVEVLICWENLQTQRYVLRDPLLGKDIIKTLDPSSFTPESLIDEESGVTLELQECQPLLEWFANNYKSFGSSLEFISDRSQEGSQFCKGFGGIGGLLRYRVDFVALSPESDLDEDDFW